MDKQEVLEKIVKEKKLNIGDDKNIEIFLNEELDEKRINEEIENGILANTIYEIATTKKKDGYYKNYLLTNQGGIKVVFRSNEVLNYPTRNSFYITDFHLILCFGRSIFLQQHGQIDNPYYENPDEILVIPLEKVEYIKIGSLTTTSYILEKTVNKSPIKGAIAGSVIAGPTGAVVGALANTGTKTKKGVNVTLDKYDLSIKLKDNDKVYYSKNFFISEVSNINRKNLKEEIESKLERTSLLISRANKEIPLNERKKIVEKTNIEFQESIKNQNKGCYVATCVYGSYDCPEVWTLRRFRDNYLDNYRIGRIFIKVYYAVSPKVVKLFGKNKHFISINKRILDKLVLKLKSKGYKDTNYYDKF